jgi:dTDP-4-dehydrorhamnose 3,5-epimerase
VSASEGENGGIQLSDSAEQALSFQSYAPQQRIDGVWIRPLKKHRAENGWFAELFRVSDESNIEDIPANLRLQQCSASRAEPNRINAFHIHPREPQNELWTVLDGILTIWLVDCRKGSATEGQKQRVILSGEEPSQLYIPSGVAHGYRAGPDGALLLYAMDQKFNPAAPNEGRLPWDHFGTELWAEDRG